MESRIDVYYDEEDEKSKIIISRLGISYANINFIDKNSNFFSRKTFSLDYSKIYNLLRDIIREKGLRFSYFKLNSKIKGVVLYNIKSSELENLIDNLVKSRKN